MSTKRKLTSNDIKQKEIEILEAFTDFCDKNGITYFLGYGTLLGAIRHKGFIPWDDDIDILVPREDYDRLLKLLQKQPLKNANEKFLAMHYSYGNLGYFFMKIVSTNTVVKEKRYDLGVNFGVWVDIFPLDGMPDERKQQARELRKNKLLLKIWEESCLADNEGSTAVLRFMRKLIKPFTHKMNTFQLACNLERSARRIRYADSRYVTAKLVIAEHKVWKKEWFANTTTAEFEGREYKIPSGWKEYLECVYGDYMKLPPENERKTHLLDGYWLEEKEDVKKFS